MHISEGVLSGPVLAAGATVAVAGVAIGLRQIDNRRIPEVAVMTAAFFVASLIHVPAGPVPASIHLTLNGFMGLILGWAAFPAILVGLFLQALLFQFGGFTGLGVNTVVMALPAVAAHLIFRPMLKNINHRRAMHNTTPEEELQGISPISGLTFRTSLTGFLAGAFSITLSAILMVLALAATDRSFVPVGKVLIVTHIINIIIEGIVTASLVTFILKVRPEIIFPAHRAAIRRTNAS